MRDHLRADGAAIALRADQAQPDAGGLAAAVVPEQVGGTVVRRDQDIGVGVVIEVGVRGAASHDRPAESRAHLQADLLELPAAPVMEQERALGIGHVLLDPVDVVIHVAVRREEQRGGRR